MATWITIELAGIVPFLQMMIFKIYFKIYQNYGFQQVIYKPTRQNRFLDVILAIEPVLVVDRSVRAPFSTCDHCAIDFTLAAPTCAITQDGQKFS